MTDRFQQASDALEDERKSLTSELKRKNNVLLKLAEKALKRSYDAHGSYVPDDNDEVDCAVAHRINMSGHKLPIIRLGAGQYVLNGEIIYGMVDQEEGELTFQTEEETVSFEQLVEGGM